jgi:hypothetical protein
MHHGSAHTHSAKKEALEKKKKMKKEPVAPAFEFQKVDVAHKAADHNIFSKAPDAAEGGENEKKEEAGGFMFDFGFGGDEDDTQTALGKLDAEYQSTAANLGMTTRKMSEANAMMHLNFDTGNAHEPDVDAEPVRAVASAFMRSDSAVDLQADWGEHRKQALVDFKKKSRDAKRKKNGGYGSKRGGKSSSKRQKH